MAKPERAIVSCAGCTLCCRNDAIILHPECGDDASQYITERLINPIDGKPALMLAKSENGDCIYLDRSVGCTIHDRAPAICREFDCAGMYERLGAARIRKAVEAGMFSQDIADRGRMLLKNRRASA